MRSIFVGSLSAIGNGGSCGTAAIWQRSSVLPSRADMNPWVGGVSPWQQCFSTLFIKRSHSCSLARFRIRAQWLFNQGNEGVDASSERSESANEDVLIFFFQLDLQTRIQCALNMEQYDIAKQLRSKLSEVETEITKQREAKRGSSSKSEAQDKSLSLLRLR